ncbi:glycosyl hydrolase family 95 catalytic domain-containing protein [Opitutus terrae]|nr:glycoside hydrolase N-terminal domain-containing protein [Opitutus terrae]
MKSSSILCSVVAALLGSTAMAAAPSPGTADVVFSESYQEPGDNRNWREGMVTGNGIDGVVSSGSPYADTFIFQNMFFALPSADPRENPDFLRAELAPTLDHVFRNDDSWKLNSRKRTFFYCFHPAHLLRIGQQERATRSYRRWTNLATAEIGVAYSDSEGDWERRTFASRSDGVIVTELRQSSKGAKLNLTLSIDDLASLPKFGKRDEARLQYKKSVADDGSYLALVAHYPSYDGSELKDAGYAGLTRVVAVGGRVERVTVPGEREAQNVGGEPNPALRISDADAVYLITKSDRDTAMGPLSAFQAASEYALVNRLASATEAVAKKYQRGDTFDYAAALAAHVELHGAEYSRVKLDLRADASDRALANEALHAKQKQQNATLNLAFLERAYRMGRYVEICCSGAATPRLCGLWTGEWNPGWRGIYTMDANVNLQVAPMNTGNLSSAPVGYINFVLRQVDDWRKNAADVYGMHDALQVPVNTDGDRAMMVETDIDYPFQYWNAGASWMLLPIFEYWQCRGNQRIPLSDRVDLMRIRQALGVADGGLSEAEAQALAARGWLDLEKDILLPLLTKQANFWEQFCNPEYFVDAAGRRQHQPGKRALEAGERFLLIPTYSPENSPRGYRSTLTVNATMDISAARDGLDMTIAVERAVNRPESAAAISRWTKLRDSLPAYEYDGQPGELTESGGGGALREWATQDYVENNNHRHSSHLYLAWPGYEAGLDPKIRAAALQAVANRDRLNTRDNTTGHGWIHRALISVRLGNAPDVQSCLLQLLASDIYYTSLVTDHNTNRKSDTYCTDASIGLVATVNESLVFSTTGVIELLPALPPGLRAGSIQRLLARSRAEIEHLEWSPGQVMARIRSDVDQALVIKCGQPWRTVHVEGGSPSRSIPGERVELTLKTGDIVTLRFE